MQNVVKHSPIRLYNITAKRGEANEVQPSIAKPRSAGALRDTSRQHYWKPVSISASAGGYMNITFVCKKCKKRAGEFLTGEQYALHSDKLERECET